MYDRFGTSSTRHHSHQHHQQHFRFTEEDIEEIYRQFFQFNNNDNDESTEFIFHHIFNRKPPKILTTKSGIDDKPFPFYSKSIYFVECDNNYNQKISSYRVKHSFEKSNREYGREILEIIRYLLQSLPFKFNINKNIKENECDEYYLIKYIISTEINQQYTFSTKCINLAQRLYNLRNHLVHWTRTKKQMSYKSINHYFNVGKQFIFELKKQPQFQYFQFLKHFKVATLNMDILHQQFISHKCKDRKQREKYGNLRYSLDHSYNEYNSSYWTRSKWFIAGMFTTIAVIVWLVRNVDIDDEPEPVQKNKR